MSPKGDKNKDASERRRHRRVPLQLLVQHRYDSLQSFMKEVAIDISVGGMYLKTDDPRELGSTLYLRFTLDDGLPLIEGIGKVVWSSGEQREEMPAGMGIEFVSLDDESRELINSIVSARFASSGSDQAS